MDFALLVPISFFIAVVMAIKFIVDARMRRRMAETNASRGPDQVDARGRRTEPADVRRSSGAWC